MRFCVALVVCTFLTSVAYAGDKAVQKSPVQKTPVQKAIQKDGAVQKDVVKKERVRRVRVFRAKRACVGVCS
jgi:hypothetical protein